MNDYSRSSKISIKELYANEMAHSIEVCFNTKQDQGAETVDPSWKLDQPTPPQSSQCNNRPGPRTASTSQDRDILIPTEERAINSKTDKDPSVLEVPATNGARYVGFKTVQHVEMGPTLGILAEDDNNWMLEQA